MYQVIRRGARLALVGIGILIGGASFAFAAGQAIGDGGVIHACYRVADDDRKGDLRVVSDPASCRTGEAQVQWNQSGPQGPEGDPGVPGPPGPVGPPGGIQNVVFYERSLAVTVPADGVEIAIVECQRFDWAASVGWELGPGLAIERIENVFQNPGARMFHVRNNNDGARQVRLSVNCVVFIS